MGTDKNTNSENPCVDKDECLDNPCKKDGQECHNTVGSYECQCKSSWYVNLDSDEKEETPCLRCNVETEIEFNEECVKCSGPTAALNDSGLCTCAKTRGMILNNGVCECNAAKNFVLDDSTENTCKCSEKKTTVLDGVIRNGVTVKMENVSDHSNLSIVRKNLTVMVKQYHGGIVWSPEPAFLKSVAKQRQ